jgi:hypothetical protein
MLLFSARYTTLITVKHLIWSDGKISKSSPPSTPNGKRLTKREGHSTAEKTLALLQPEVQV